MQQWVRVSVAGAVVAAMTLVGTTAASAQTREGFLATLAVFLGASTPTDPSPSAGGAGISARELSPRDRTLARVIYQAQRPEASAPKMTLEQITARKMHGETWNEVLKDMKSRGLVSERSLLQALMQDRGDGVARATTGTNGKPAARTAVMGPRDDESGDGQKLKP
jgi:hypothetical protein